MVGVLLDGMDSLSWVPLHFERLRLKRTFFFLSLSPGRVTEIERAIEEVTKSLFVKERETYILLYKNRVVSIVDNRTTR